MDCITNDEFKEEEQKIIAKYNWQLLEMEKERFRLLLEYGFHDTKNEIVDIYPSDKQWEQIIEKNRIYYHRLYEIVRRIEFLEMMNNKKYYKKVLKILEQFAEHKFI